MTQPQAELLLHGKLIAPPLSPDVVTRVDAARLFEIDTRVTLVSAPPGYGKTTAVRSALATAGIEAGWLTLDEADNDPAVFLAYLRAAVRTVVGDLPSGPETYEWLRLTDALIPLLNALEGERRRTLVLDDYHVITNPRVHELVGFLAGHLGSNVRLIVVTRHDPPLPMARLRARSELTEIRADDLRFTTSEAREFFSRTMRIDLLPTTVERLTTKTEGWIAGLQLAGLSLRGRTDPDVFVDTFDARQGYVVDYLTDEALAHLEPTRRAFVESTCILERLTGSLCDAVTGSTGGEGMLRRLAEDNVFITTLDGQRRWYRYHALFAELLASGLAPERRRELDAAAGAWFESNGFPGASIRHLLAAGENERAADLIEVAGDSALERGEFETIVAWSRELPAEILVRHPELTVTTAWALFFRGDLGGAEKCLTSSTTGGSPAGRRAGRRACLEAWFANRRDAPNAVSLARRALDSLDANDRVFLSLAHTTLGESLLGHDVSAARGAFEEAHRLARGGEHAALYAGSVYSLVNAELLLGQRNAAERRCHEAIEELGAHRSGSPPELGMIHLALAVALYEANDLALARQHFAIGNELVASAGIGVTMLGASEWQEILTLHALGEPDLARRRLNATRRTARLNGIPRVEIAMDLLEVELELREGNGALIRRRLASVERQALAATLGIVRDRGRETVARVLLACGDPQAALAELVPLADEQRAGGRILRLVWTLVCEAAAFDRLGYASAAEAAMREAVGIALPERLEAPFADPVLDSGSLRDRFGASHARSDSGGLGDRLTLARSGVPPQIAAQSMRDRLVEPLSLRELEVLRLVAAGLSNEEISRGLFISPGTAKWHVHNILGKLGCRNRAEGIVRAQALRLI